MPPDTSHQKISADLPGKGKREGRKKGKMEERTFFFFFFLFFTGKKHFTPGKNLGKMTLPPLKNILLTPLARILTFE